MLATIFAVLAMYIASRPSAFRVTRSAAMRATPCGHLSAREQFPEMAGLVAVG